MVTPTCMYAKEDMTSNEKRDDVGYSILELKGLGTRPASKLNLQISLGC